MIFDFDFKPDMKAIEMPNLEKVNFIKRKRSEASRRSRSHEGKRPVIL